MARNEEISVYGIPSINKPRYDHSYTVRRKTTGNVGQIIPIYNNILIQPGDTVSINLRSFFRLTTSLFPSMDNLTADIFCFAQDLQNDWDHLKELFGEDTVSPFEEPIEYMMPQVRFKPDDIIEHDDIMHHLAVPAMESKKGAVPTVTRTDDIEIERLSYNTYIDIYNHFFRDQNYIPKIKFSKGDETINYADFEQKKLLKAARFHDYFQGTPEPVKGGQSFIPLGTEAPVITGEELHAVENDLIWAKVGADTPYNPSQWRGIVTGAGVGITATDSNVGTVYQDQIAPANLYTDLTQAVGSTINALRLITAEQHIKEEMMWYGSMFEDIIMSQWGVSMNATSFRIPEYLGGKRININMDSVLQTSSSDATSPQGNAVGYSVTLDEDFMFTKSFTTWQNIMIVVVIRQDHTYSQGIANQHFKKRKFDFYWDEFAGLGAQPRLLREIAITGTSSDIDVWNYAPAWREYTSEVDRACGLLQTGVDDSLENYTYNDYYNEIPNSGQSWIEETPEYVDRTLVVPSTTTDQFMMDFVFDVKKTSIVPNFRLPGLDKL